MADVIFKKGLRANLPQTITEGTWHVTTDERALYLDIDADTRIRIGDFQAFDTVEALNANTNPSETALYYVKNINCLAKWNGADYIQINPDTGMTSVEIVGTGNVVTAASYDAATRKMTLTMGKTMAERSYVGEIPDGYTETNIIAYINKKAEETLTAASGGSSESAASVLAALNTFKSETSPRIDALEKDSHTHDNQTELDKIAEGDKAKWDAAQANAEKAASEALATAKTELEGKIKNADDKAVGAQGDVDALAAKVGEVPADKTVVQMISDAKAAATYDDAKVKADIKTNADAITKLNGAAAVEGSVDYKIAQAVAKIMENPDDTMNSIKELVDWCNAHATEALALTNKVTQAEKDIDALEALVGDKAVAVQITEAIATALKIDGADKYALASDLTAAIARIAALESKSHEHANKVLLDSYTQTEVNLADAVAKKHEHKNAAVLDGVTAEKIAAWDAAQKNAEGTAAAALAAAKTELEGKITAEASRADAAEKKALADATKYTDEAIAAAKLVWGSF